MSPVAVVTGAGRGIGAAVSSLLMAEGWEVLGVDKTWPEGQPEGCMTVDLRAPEELEKRLASMEWLDGMVNNAAIGGGLPLAETDRETWCGIQDVNLTAAALLTRSALPALVASRGAVVNVSSVHAVATSSGNSAYAAAKAGLAGFTRSAAVELGPLGVRVNSVLPGAVDTEMLLPGLEFPERSAELEKLADRTPLRRVAKPLEVAAAIAFLLDGERASFITGQSLTVDGGALAALATE